MYRTPAAAAAKHRIAACGTYGLTNICKRAVFTCPVSLGASRTGDRCGGFYTYRTGSPSALDTRSKPEFQQDRIVYRMHMIVLSAASSDTHAFARSRLKRSYAQHSKRQPYVRPRFHQKKLFVAATTNASWRVAWLGLYLFAD